MRTIPSSATAEGNAFTRWRRRRRTWREARSMLKETARIVRQQKKRLKPEELDALRAAATAVDTARKTKDVTRTRAALEKLDELLDKSAAFARKGPIREYAESIGGAVLIALLLRAFVVEAFKIPSGSMIPTLKVGDHIFVNKFIYGLTIPFTDKKVLSRLPSRGEVVVFKYPQDSEKDFIKRIVAVGGDTIEVKNNQLFLNGKPVPRRRLPGPCKYPDTEENSDHYEVRPCEAFEEELDGNRYIVIQDLNGLGAELKARRIPDGHVFAMGDNRDNSHDSRVWGTVPHSLIKGKAMIIWWSNGLPQGVRWSRFFDRVHAAPDAKKSVQP